MSKKSKPYKKYNDIQFEHLAPVDNVNEKVFFDAFDYALKQKNVHNIALTGNYGSGKSSIIDSYIKKCGTCCFFDFLLKQMLKIWLLNRIVEKFSKRWFLKISLATFAIGEDGDNSDQDGNIPDTINQKIEKSILQQIFYRESGRKFPNSRFCRIKKYNFFRKFLIEIGVMLLLFVPIYVTKGDSWNFVEKLIVTPKDNIEYVFVFLFVIAFLVLLYKVISLISKIKLSKFSYQDVEIEFNESGNDESLLNKYLDELLYFFEVTEYNVVVLEDLDRFKNAEIFIKLRELNVLLNNYKKIKRKIVFVYALRDEVFKDSSRTKFFDFIIPVIPIMNNQNSCDILLNQIKSNSECVLKELDENFMQDIGLYVDDMRLLKNCINEFNVYDQIINKEDYEGVTNQIEANNENVTKRNRNKIFALVLYKNLYPKDFALLAKNDGELYGIFERKKNVINEEIPKIENDIDKLKKEIKEIENETLTDIRELRLIYIATILSKKPKEGFLVDDAYDFTSDEKFDQLKKDSPFKYYKRNDNCYGYTRYDQYGLDYSFSTIEKEVNAQYTYAQREMKIKKKTNGRIEILKKRIEEKNTEIATIRQMPIAKLLDKVPVERFVDGDELKTINKDFIVYLLRNSFIDENYFDYISYFYANYLSKNDKDYLLLIKNQKTPSFGLLLNNIEYLIKRIKEIEWPLPAVLNYSMLSYLLEKDDVHLDNFIRTLWNYKENNSECIFLTEYNNEQKILSSLYQRIYDIFCVNENWTNVFFENEGSIVLYNFFVYVNFEKTKDETIKYLMKNVSFLYGDDIDEEIVSTKIKQYNLKFNLLNDTTEYSIYDILLKNNAYVISRENFNVIIKNAVGENTDNTIADYYTQISKLSNKYVKEYVLQNIEDFVRNVILSTENSTTESEDSFVELLNMESLLTELKIELIERNDCVVSDVAKIKSVEIILADAENKSVDLRNILYEYKKVNPSWNNVFVSFNYNGNKLDQSLIIYLNDDNIVNELIEEKSLSDEEVANKNGNYNTASNFYRSVLNEEKLSLNSYSALMKKCPWQYNRLKKYDVSSEKMKALIDLKCLAFTSNNYDGIRENHPDLLSKFTSIHFDDFISKWNELNISVNSNDIRLFLDENELDNEQKKTLLTTDFSIWQNVRKDETFEWLGKKVVELDFSGQLSVSASLILKKLDEESTVVEFISLQGEYLNEDEIINAINEKTGDEYKTCCKHDGKRCRLANTSVNIKFCKMLQERGLVSSYKPDGKEIKIVQKRL